MNPNLTLILLRSTTSRLFPDPWVPLNCRSACQAIAVLEWDPSTTLFFVHLGVSINGNTPARWMVYFMENPSIKWMITRRTPQWLLKHCNTTQPDRRNFQKGFGQFSR